MTHCIRCHRPMKAATESGMGPVCAKKAKAQAIPRHERDLFGFNIPAACESALARLAVHVESLAVSARMAVRHEFAAAKRRLGVWA